MHIERHKLRELQYLQEDIAEYFTDENLVSGATYWTCVEAVAIAILAEFRGDIINTEEIDKKIKFFKKIVKKNIYKISVAQNKGLSTIKKLLINNVYR